MSKTKKILKHKKEYNELVPQEIFEIEDSDEVAEMYLDMFGY